MIYTIHDRLYIMLNRNSEPLVLDALVETVLGLRALVRSRDAEGFPADLHKTSYLWAVGHVLL